MSTIGALMEMDAGVMDMELAPHEMVTPSRPLMVTDWTEASMVMEPRLAVVEMLPILAVVEMFPMLAVVEMFPC
jgi:hypothetical protein